MRRKSIINQSNRLTNDHFFLLIKVVGTFSLQVKFGKQVFVFIVFQHVQYVLK